MGLAGSVLIPDALDARAFERDLRGRPIEHRGRDIQRPAGSHVGLPRLRFHEEPGAQRDGLIEFRELDLGQRIRDRGDQRARLDQRGNRLLGMRRLVVANGLVQNRLDRGAAGQAIPRRVDAVEQVLGRGRAADDGEVGAARAGTPHGAGALAVVHAAAEHRQFFVGVAQDRVERAGIGLPDRRSPVRAPAEPIPRRRGAGCAPPRPPRPPAAAASATAEAAETRGLHQPLGLPHLHVLQLLGKHLRIGRRGEGFLAEDGRRLVLPVSVARRAAEAEQDHVRPVAADHPHHVRQNAVVSPFLQRLVGGARESEIDGAREELLGAVDLPRGQQFLRADDAELRALFGADQVLAAFAARQRKVRRAHVPAAREVGEHGGALVVGVCRDVQHRTQFVQLVQRLFDFGRAGKAALCRKGSQRREQHSTQNQPDTGITHCLHILPE